MLHGVIPAAFFATLLRRYLDSISETPQYSVASTSTIGCFETSAAIATVGMAVYGISRLSRKKNEIETPKTFEIVKPQEEETGLRLQKRPVQRKVTRKHRRKDKWFLKNMKKYKRKYGQKIGKLMNQFLGVPAADHPNLEPIDLDLSDSDELENDLSDDRDNSPFDQCTELVDVAAANDIFDGERAAPSKCQFEDDDDDIKVERRVSSSLELKTLLRNNFEMQRKKKLGRRRSSDSLQSGYSSDSYKSGYSEVAYLDEDRSTKRKRKLPSKLARKCYRDEEKRRKKKYKTTRSGRCYNNLFS